MAQPIPMTRFALVGILTFLPMTLAAQTSYRDSIDAWRRQRAAGLLREDGWLNLAGLFWLQEGENTVGSGAQNRLVFPAGKCDEVLGSFWLKNGVVELEAHAPGRIFHGETAVDGRLQIFPYKEPIVLRHADLRWFVIKRGEKIGIRLRDLKHPALQAFRGIECYPVRKKWRVEARLVPHAVETSIPILDVLGQTTAQRSPGALVFRLNGREYRLDALESGDELFILFADETNGAHTYPAGRFLYADKPGPDGRVILDFNKAFNPPCAFTDFATCPLPPPQNRLPVAVRAGEKRYGEH